MSSTQLPTTQSVYRTTGEKDIKTGIRLDTKANVPTVGHGQVLVRIRAVSLNYRDTLIVKGTYPVKTKENGIPTSDGAGEVVSVHSSVASLKPGDRVVTAFIPGYLGGAVRHSKGIAGALGGDLDGVLAQYVVADHTALVKIPASLSFEEAATLPCAGVTAYNALYSTIDPLRPDHVVLIQGTGGVSVWAAQIALAAGARVIATSSSDEKLKRLAALGVAEKDLINYKKNPEWSKTVRELTDGLGVDNVVEVGGPNTIRQAVAAARFGGEVSIIGFVGGAEGEGLNPLAVLRGAVTVRGIVVGSVDHLRRLVDSVAQGRIHPIVDKVFPFAQATDAYAYLESQQHFGKVVIRVD